MVTARSAERRWAATALALLACVALGCGGGSEQAVRLVVISPHRDEIREEVALGFQDWFAERTGARLKQASQALRAEPKHPDHAAVARLLADWSPADLEARGIAGPLRQWQKQPDADTAATLATALDAWQRDPDAARVRVAWQDIGGGTSQIARYVRSSFEAQPDGIGIDLVFGGGTDIYLRFASQGLLQPVDLSHLTRGRIPPTLHGVPLYDEQGRWYGPVISSFGILSNREVLRRLGIDEPPRTWSDLGRPELAGWVGAGDPRLTGSVHMVYEIILQGDGWEEGFRKLLRLGANAHSFIRDSGTLTRSVVTGDTATAGNIDVNALSAVGRNPEMMVFVLPVVEQRKNAEGKLVRNGGTVINADAIAMLKGAPRPGLARAFMEFTLSDACQKLFLLLPGVPGGPRRFPLCRLSVVEALYRGFPPEQRSVGAANPFQQTDALRYNSQLGQQRWDALNDLIGAFIVDAQDELSAAWHAILRSGLPAETIQRLSAELFEPPCTEAELAAHAKRIAQGDPHARTMQVNDWSEQARQRYRRIRAETERR
ncbi:MAG: ABC transporter substrate-binding protein [Planctomycetia bacterium]|nr:ABC transporter substrate-binding protein [Planctomycetia bacterium]